MYITNVNGNIEKIPKEMYFNDKLMNIYLWKNIYNVSIIDEIENIYNYSKKNDDNIQNKENQTVSQSLQIHNIYSDLGL